ncbi:MAG TPA: hypothetical protein VD948_06610 [Rhodothermales bacterium]|nr:hypothetical protein [Rhodothermales bacterium]
MSGDIVSVQRAIDLVKMAGESVKTREGAMAWELLSEWERQQAMAIVDLHNAVKGFGRGMDAFVTLLSLLRQMPPAPGTAADGA